MDNDQQINITSMLTWRKNCLEIKKKGIKKTNINDLQLEVSKKQTLNLSTHVAVFELLAYWLQVGEQYHTAKLR